MRRVLQSPAAWGLLFVCGGLYSWLRFVARPLVGGEPEVAVFASAHWFAGFWVLGSAQLLWLRPGEWERPGTAFRAAAVVVVLGVVAHLAHVAVAFGVYHDFSHEKAVAHTARTAGVGWGVYVNYLFAAVWLADVVWLATATGSYARRPPWVGRAVHGFLAFVVFNATVVYGQWPTRLAGVGWFAILGYSWWRRGRLGERPV